MSERALQPRGSGQWARGAAGLLGSAAVLAALTVLARLVGFGRVFVFAGSVGSQCAGSVYTVANLLPNVLYEVAAGGALAGAVVPVLAGQLVAGRPQDADRTASALLTWTCLVLTPLAVLLAVLAGPLSELFLGGGAALVVGTQRTECLGSAQLGARMLVIFAPQVLLYGIGIVLVGILQAKRRFVWPAVVPLLSSLVVICAYLGYAAVSGADRSGRAWLPGGAALFILAGGTTLGVVALSLPLLWPVYRSGTRLRFSVTFPEGVAGRVISLAAAGILALLAQQGAALVSLYVAWNVGGEQVPAAALYAQTLYLLPGAVLAAPLATVVFPRLSEQAALARADLSHGFAATAAWSTRLVLLAACFGSAALIATAPAAQRFFVGIDVAHAAGAGGAPHGGGAATASGGLASLADAVTALAPGVAGWSLIALVSRALYAQAQGRAATTATALGWAVAVGATVLSVFGLLHTGMRHEAAAMVGLGIGNTVGMTVAGGLLLLALRRTAGAEALDGVSRVLVTGAVAAAVAGLTGRWTGDQLQTVPAWLAAAVAATLSLLVFAALTAALNPRDLHRLHALHRLGGLGGLVAAARRRST